MLAVLILTNALTQACVAAPDLPDGGEVEGKTAPKSFIVDIKKNIALPGGFFAQGQFQRLTVDPETGAISAEAGPEPEPCALSSRAQIGPIKLKD